MVLESVAPDAIGLVDRHCRCFAVSAVCMAIFAGYRRLDAANGPNNGRRFDTGWVTSGSREPRFLCPLSPRKRKSRDAGGTSALCHFQTFGRCCKADRFCIKPNHRPHGKLPRCCNHRGQAQMLHSNLDDNAREGLVRRFQSRRRLNWRRRMHRRPYAKLH